MLRWEMSSEQAAARSNAHCPRALESLILTTQLLQWFPFPSNCFYLRATSLSASSLGRTRRGLVAAATGNDCFRHSVRCTRRGNKALSPVVRGKGYSATPHPMTKEFDVSSVISPLSFLFDFKKEKWPPPNFYHKNPTHLQAPGHSTPHWPF